MSAAGPSHRLRRAGHHLCVAAASLVVALNWTPINYETLFGMQGRYWLPVLPLALLLVKGNRSVCARRDLSRGAALAVTACTLLTLLQGYSLYASCSRYHKSAYTIIKETLS